MAYLRWAIPLGLALFLALAPFGALTGHAQTGPDLTITASHSGQFYVGSKTALYTFVIKNISGTSPTTLSYVVNVNLPTGQTASGFTGAEGWSCTNAALPSCTRNR